MNLRVKGRTRPEWTLRRWFCVPMLWLLVGISISSHAQSVLPNPAGVFIAGGMVVASVIQSDGKLVIGGTFTAVGGVPRRNIARLNADGSVDLGFDPSADSGVSALAVFGNILYVGGSFSTIGGQPRNALAALDQVTGLAMPWAPGSPPTQPAQISAIAVSADGSTVYVGGQFTVVGGASRNNIAALASTDGGALPLWNPGASGTVNALVLSGNTLYAGGWFQTMDGQMRNCVAALDAVSGAASAWNPSANGGIYALAVAGSTVYAGGQFSAIGGQSRDGIAALDAATGLATSWNPAASNGFPAVYAIAISSNTVYLGGNFQNNGARTPQNLEAVDTTTGVVSGWSPNPDGAVGSLALSGTTVYAGGAFSNAGGNLTGGFARIDAITGASVASQLSSSGGSIASIQSQPDGKTIVGGSFTAIGDVARTNIARLNGDGSVDDTWNPGADVDGPITALLVSGNIVYVAGDFQNIGGHFRRGLAAIDAGTGVATTWQPDPDQSVFAIAVSGNTVYVGGNFQYVGNSMRPYLAALDANTGLASLWDPQPDNGVFSLAIAGNELFAGGAFQNVAGQQRANLAAIDTNTGFATSWNPSPTGQINALAIVGNTLYVGGNFYQIGSNSRQGIAAANVATGAIEDWNPGANSFGANVLALAVSGDDVVVGGIFTHMGGQPRSNLAAVDAISGQAFEWNVPVLYDYSQASVSAVSFGGNGVYVGGQFGTIAGVARGALAAVTSPDIIFQNGFE